MSRFHATSKGNVPFTQAEEDEQDIVDTAYVEAKPMRDWEKLMQESDAIDMPRWLEDHIEFEHGGISAGRQDKYNAKKEKRTQRP